MCGLGFLYAHALGVKRNYKVAMSWYHDAAAGGSTAAMVYIGSLYLKGWGVPKSISKAKKWFERAAASGDRRGEIALERLRKPAPVAEQK